MKIRLVLILMFIMLPVQSFAQAESGSGSIAGTITDAVTRQPLPGVNILIDGTSTGAATDVNGRFEINRVNSGAYILRISFLGYETVMVPDVIVRSGRITAVDKSLKESYYETGEVVVEGGKYFESTTGSLVSAQNMGYEEIRRSAGAVGDVLRLAQVMPGVVIANDTRNDLIVRGGTPAENLIIIDNIEFPSINHYASQNSSGGPISMLNTEFIREANFLSGGFSSQYGDRLSSVLDISLREGNRKSAAYDVEMGIAGFGVLAEGPVSDKGSYILSLRRSYLELLKDGIGLTAVPEYWNYNSKFVYEPDNANKLWLVSMGGIDEIDFNVDPNDPEDPSLQGIEDEGWQSVSGLNWQHLFGKSGYGVLGISDGIYFDKGKITDEQYGGITVLEQNSYDGVTNLRYDVTLHSKTAGIVKAGAMLKRYRARYSLRQPYGVQNPLSTDSARVNAVDINDNFASYNPAVYAEYSPELGSRLTVTGGVRFDHYEILGKSRVSPRISAKYMLTDKLSASASYGIYYQQPALIYIKADPVNINLDPMESSQAVAGFNYFPVDDIRISLEGYYKQYDKYPVSVEYPTLTLANKGDDFGAGGLLFPMVSNGTGTSYGLELYVQKKLTESLYGQISYSYAKTEHKALDGVDRSASFDIPHILTIVGGYKTGDWEFSTKFAYSAGRPYTPFNMVVSEAQNRGVLDISNINGSRTPAYQRLDIRVDRRFNFEGWSMIFFAEFLNVYNHKNIQQYIWNPKTKRPASIDQYSFLPNIGFNIKF